MYKVRYFIVWALAVFIGVDLAYPVGDKIIPIEVKSNATGTLKSFHQSNHPYAIRMYTGEFKIENLSTIEGTPFLLMNLPIIWERSFLSISSILRTIIILNTKTIQPKLFHLNS